jgi:SAM-dependent methyltransferase
MILSIENLNKEIKKCPNCGNNNQNNTLILQTKPLVNMIKCSICKLAYANQMPNETFLKNLYDPKIYKSFLTNNSDNTKKLAEKIYNKTKFKNKNVKILDYGGGNGELSKQIIELLNKNNINAESLVVDIHNSTNGEKIYFKSVENFKDDQNAYDLILASAVLEHLPNFRDVLENLLSKLENDGYFYCRTPWEFELSKLMKFYKIKWPRHLYDIGGDFWINFFRNKKDFNIVMSETSVTEISKKNIFKYLIAQFLKNISKFEFYIKKNKISLPRWPFVGGWDLIVKKNA